MCVRQGEEEREERGGDKGETETERRVRRERGRREREETESERERCSNNINHCRMLYSSNGVRKEPLNANKGVHLP